MRDLYEISCELDEIANGLSRSITTIGKVFEDFPDTVNLVAPDNRSMLEDYYEALMLVLDRIMDEHKHLDNTSEKLFKLFQQTKAGDVNA